MLNASSPRSFAIAHPPRPHIFGANDRKREASKTHILSAFSASRKISASHRSIIFRIMSRRISRARQDATSGATRAQTRFIKRKHWFFCRAVVIRMRCSRSPRALYDIATHSLARRAAWRRSERRRRSQRRKRAQGRPSAGRRSKHTPLASLRLRTTSMTASHGPARVEGRRAHRDRRSTPPAPVDDRGRRRDRGSSFTGPRVRYARFQRAVAAPGR
jgi:hypothetical protein